MIARLGSQLHEIDCNARVGRTHKKTDDTQHKHSVTTHLQFLNT